MFQIFEIPKSSSSPPRKVPALPPLPADGKQFESELYEVRIKNISLSI